ncbi:MAG: glycosyltransferase family 4 protein [Verrucomicrobiales bacterium]|nr:glycosyltransferase family 4 protein [Verrucomicrobiales bacterium]
MKILWVKSGPLFPLNTGGRRRTHAMLRELAKEHEVTYLASLPENQELHEDEAGADYAQDKIWIRSVEPEFKSAQGLRALLTNLFFSTRPYVLDRYENPSLRSRLLELEASSDFDLIVCDFLTPAVNFEFDAIQTPVVLFQHNIEAQIWKRLAAEKKNPLVKLYFHSQFLRMAEAERLLSASFAGVITVSPEDATRCRDDYALSNVLGAVPTGVDTDFFSPPEPRTPETGLIGFLGSMDWMPNVECVQYFAEEIFPTILERFPKARFRIIGRNPTPAVQRLGKQFPNIEVTGTVEDVREHLDACHLLVVPLRSGGGTRIKIFEAMAEGVPVVSTTIGAEGLPVRDGDTILLADEPDSFANAVIDLLESDELGARLSGEARSLLARDHSWEAVSLTFIDLCQPILTSRSS